MKFILLKPWPSTLYARTLENKQKERYESETDSPKSVFRVLSNDSNNNKKNCAMTQLINSHSVLSVPFLLRVYIFFFSAVWQFLSSFANRKRTHFYLSTSSSLLAVYYNSIMSTNAHFFFGFNVDALTLLICANSFKNIFFSYFWNDKCWDCDWKTNQLNFFIA